MNFACKFAITLLVAAASASLCFADTLATHRIPAALAIEAASETIAACARQGYRETAVVLDADGATIVAVRGDGAGIHTLDSASAVKVPLDAITDRLRESEDADYCGRRN